MRRNLRERIASLAYALVIASLAAGCPAVAARAQTTPPPVVRIDVGRDTIWFVADVDRDGDSALLRRRWALVRREGTWLSVDRQAPPGPERIPSVLPERTHPVALARGWRLAFARAQADSGRQERAGTFTLLPPAPDTGAIALTPGWVSDWLLEDDSLWVTLSGDGAAGSLGRVRLSTRRLEEWRDSALAGVLPQQLAATRRAIWIRLEDPSGNGVGRGLARFDRAAQRLARLPAENSWLPDSDVVAIAAAGDSLLVATSEALAVHDLTSGRTDVRWFHATPVARPLGEGRRGFHAVGDSTIVARWSLVRQRDPREDRARLVVDLGELLTPAPGLEQGSRWSASRFLEAVRRIPAAHFDSALAVTPPDYGRALAHPLLEPLFLRDTTAPMIAISLPVIRAIGLLGAPRNLAYLDRSVPDPDSVDAYYLMESTLARARLGDSSWVPALVNALPGWGLGAATHDAVGVLAELRDTSAIPVLLRMARESASPLGVAEVARLASGDRWRRVVREVSATPGLRAPFVVFLEQSAPARTALFADTALAPALTRALVGVLGVPVAGDAERARIRREAHEAAVRLAVATADTAALPYVIALMTQDSSEYVMVSSALIRYTGTDSVPGGPYASLAERARAQRFWSDMLRRHGFPRTPVAIVTGTAALERWTRR